MNTGWSWSVQPVFWKVMASSPVGKLRNLFFSVIRRELFNSSLITYYLFVIQGKRNAFKRTNVQILLAVYFLVFYTTST